MWRNRRRMQQDEIRRAGVPVYLVCRAVSGAGERTEARYYHIRLTENDQTVGRCELHPQHEPKQAFIGNIGYCIKPAHRGHHYAALACFLLADIALARGMDYLTITCDPDNAASRRTIEFLGARFRQRLMRSLPVESGGGMQEKLEYIWRLVPAQGRKEGNGGMLW